VAHHSIEVVAAVNQKKIAKIRWWSFNLHPKQFFWGKDPVEIF
jgi:hypothetical protein